MFPPNVDFPASTCPMKTTLTCSLPYMSWTRVSSSSSSCSLTTASASRDSDSSPLTDGAAEVWPEGGFETDLFSLVASFGSATPDFGSWAGVGFARDCVSFGGVSFFSTSLCGAALPPIFKTLAGPVGAVDLPGIGAAEGLPDMGARGGGKLGKPLGFDVSTDTRVSLNPIACGEKEPYRFLFWPVKEQFGPFARLVVDTAVAAVDRRHIELHILHYSHPSVVDSHTETVHTVDTLAERCTSAAVVDVAADNIGVVDKTAVSRLPLRGQRYLPGVERTGHLC